MDYKYIVQLLECYWQCETSLEEEDILRAFFSQSEIPAELKQYQPLFTYEQSEKQTDVLGEEFDEKMLSKIDEAEPVKARTITMTHRLMPLFKAAAVVAIILTLGNAMQVPFDNGYPETVARETVGQGVSVALKTDSAVIDSMRQSNLQALPDMRTLTQE